MGHSERRGPYHFDQDDTWRIGFDPRQDLRVKIDPNVAAPAADIELEWHGRHHDEAWLWLSADVHSSHGSLSMPAVHFPHLLYVISGIVDCVNPHTDDEWRDLIMGLRSGSDENPGA